jgi:hypothetical protein
VLPGRFGIVRADAAEAGDAQRQPPRALQRGKEVMGQDLADGAETALSGKGHRDHSATGGGGLSSTSHLSRPKGPPSSSAPGAAAPGFARAEALPRQRKSPDPHAGPGRAGLRRCRVSGPGVALQFHHAVLAVEFIGGHGAMGKHT